MRDRRLELGLSQTALGRLAGVDQAWISRIERDPTAGSTTMRRKLADALGRPEVDLFPVEQATATEAGQLLQGHQALVAFVLERL